MLGLLALGFGGTLKAEARSRRSSGGRSGGHGGGSKGCGSRGGPGGPRDKNGKCPGRRK